MTTVGRLAHNTDLVLGAAAAALLIIMLVGLAIADRWRRRRR